MQPSASIDLTEEEASSVTQPSAANSGQEEAGEQEAASSSGAAAADPVMLASSTTSTANSHQVSVFASSVPVYRFGLSSLPECQTSCHFQVPPCIMAMPNAPPAQCPSCQMPWLPVIKSQAFFTVLQAAQKRGLAGRLVRGIAPMVTYPATAARVGVVSGVALSTSPVRGTFLVAKWVGKGLLDYASLTENRQEAASISGSAAADPSLPSTDDTSAATSTQVHQQA